MDANRRRSEVGLWFVGSAEVEAIGEAKSDVMTTFMEGTPFEVRTMRPFVQGGSGGSNASGGSQSESRAVTRVTY